MKFSKILVNSLNNIGVISLFAILFFPIQVEGAIYVCVDNNGARHYSDKKCAINKALKSEVMNNSGKYSLPDSVQKFTHIIQMLKNTLSLINQQTPGVDLYQRAYKYSLDADSKHNKFLSIRHKTMPVKYNPFEPEKLTKIIAAISKGCRIDAYMTVCGAIEGDDWLSTEEQNYRQKQRAGDFQYYATPQNNKLLCEKAKRANQGGVISKGMQEVFCQENQGA